MEMMEAEAGQEMDRAFVAEVAAALVREFLSRKGLQMTAATLDQELPRSARAIRTRQELRRVLHLEAAYRRDKAKGSPLKTSLELITLHCLSGMGLPMEVPSGAASATVAEDVTLQQQQQEGQQLQERRRWSPDSTRGPVPDLPAEGCRVTPNTGGPPSSPSNPNEEANGQRSLTGSQLLPSQTLTLGSSSLPTQLGCVKLPDPGPEARRRASEKLRLKPGLVARGMMAGPIACSPEDSAKKRVWRRPPHPPSPLHSGDREPRPPSPLPAPFGHRRESPTGSAPPLGPLMSRSLSPMGSARGLPHSTGQDSRSRDPSWDPSVLPALRPLERERTRPGLMPESGGGLDYDAEERPGGPTSGGPLVATTHGSDRCQTAPRSHLPRADSASSLLALEDVGDEFTEAEAIRPKVPPPRKLQTEARAIDFSLAKELKSLLFGSSLAGFRAEWTLQGFTFSDDPPLRYGIMQNKGGPCGVLAAVQACVLQKLLFRDGGSGSPRTRPPQPSSTLRTDCLVAALADILWRASGADRPVVTLASGTQQFTPAGKYKADGVLETLMLYSMATKEDLVGFLQQNIHQFEAGPLGCILLTLSAICSRSVASVREDFDVPTNHLIGAHGYCTQELVNLLLTGRAVSNVFDGVMELDSGDGSMAPLRGITARSDIGLLSLFEHYDVCQVGSHLKTPRYPIWLVCSESHFSVLFSLREDLLQDRTAQRKFDLFYFDGLAGQQEEVQLTVDTTQPETGDPTSDLTPPLEHCIRTKWKGALVDWNGTEPWL
ncbi:LOW QUALITY PROTEIN: probable ubiquitin carboxyl-terminal hydrolase MINDY-4 [Tachyglossus aculeatus]|uniref:LOW QUALITY PROTEIN: probable ubiquitin carboxyl-terminal hydrolase MINDY-4 n=1 Tax=Tachyglossus aculeatus TaxID=9261 RepID=UPI0018F436FE|nr:LOW QUALITY PROTEIN: probable ubiquitin carboxyl-terminal hydrolase MINDY-4 [Tachyglossus aculeatus]